MMLVAGFSGIGKTAVVNEVHKPIVRQRGYFIRGKYDQFNRNIPFSAFVQAFRDMMGQLLSELDEELEHWKTKILQAVGDNGQVLIDVIPELEQVIGQQPKATELSGTAAQNRFNLLFQKFIRVFTTPEHPLTIFLDDLQWADSASLNLMKVLMEESETGYLLLLGAYRDNEVFPAHPLIVTLEELAKNKGAISTITLKPLAIDRINQLVAQTLSCGEKLAQPLTDLVYQKTQGNPFFTTQFLRGLYEDRLITLNPEVGYWECDLVKIRDAALTDNVVEFMSSRLHKLPKKTQDVLKLAACIGNQFDLETLAVVCEHREYSVATDLWMALQEGFVLPESKSYKFFQGDEKEAEQKETVSVRYRFLHDRVQQAAYSLIEQNQKEITHLKIGKLLLKNTSPEERHEKIFAIVNQLNFGVKLIDEVKEREELARLNLMAGQKAKSTTAYSAAVEYLTLAKTLLAKESWKKQYDLTLCVYQALAESEYLNTHFEKSLSILGIIDEQAKQTIDIVNSDELKIQIYIALDKQIKAIETGLQVLEKLKISLLPFQPELSNFPQLKALEKIPHLPEMQDVEQLAALRILMVLTPPIHHVKPNLFPSVALTSIALCLEGGNSALASCVYGVYGLFLSAVLGNADLAYYAGKLSLSILEKYYAKELASRTYVTFAVFLSASKESARNTIPLLQKGIEIGLEEGNLEDVGYCIMANCAHLFIVGEVLEIVVKQQAKYLDLLSRIKQKHCLEYGKIWHSLTLSLQGSLEDSQGSNGSEFFQDSEMISYFEKTENHQLLYALYLTKSILAYTLEESQEAVSFAKKAEQSEGGAFGVLLIVEHNFYAALALLCQYCELDETHQKQALIQVESYQNRMVDWAKNAPMNFEHKSYLIQAEKSRVLGNKFEAIEFYDRAIALAKENKYLQEEALANELAAKFYLNWGKEKVASGYMQEAYYGYAHWGAKVKTDHLEANYPQLLAPILQKHCAFNPLGSLESLTQTLTSTQKGNSQSSTHISETLDFASILQAAQKLSSTIELEQLLGDIVRIILTNAGAQKIALLVPDGQQWQLQARAELTHERTVVTQTLLESLTPESRVPIRLIQYVKNTQEPVLINEAHTEISGIIEGYLLKHQPQSVFCIPLRDRGELVAIIYLEHATTKGVFTSNRQTIIEFFCAQAAVSLQNAKLYHQAQTALTELQQAQLQLVQSEKMSALGNLVAGVAHEINNPVGFLQGNIEPAQEYVQDLLRLIDLYQEKMPNPDADIEEVIEEIDLDFIREDVMKLLASMNMGVERIRKISTSLRTFSRTDREQKTSFNIHEGIDSTLLILKHRTKANEHRPKIEVVKEYGALPEVECFPGQLNQVFMNILANAIDAFDEANEGKTYQEIEAHPNVITIRTSREENRVQIEIQDNGCGMTDVTRERIFDQGFTTKGVGKGTGLGMAIAHQIITEKHGGTISCVSEIGFGTSFILKLQAPG